MVTQINKHLTPTSVFDFLSLSRFIFLKLLLRIKQFINVANPIGRKPCFKTAPKPTMSYTFKHNHTNKMIRRTSLRQIFRE